MKTYRSLAPFILIASVFLGCSDPNLATQTAQTAAESADAFFTKENKRENDESVAWLFKQLDQEKAKDEANEVTLNSILGHIENQRHKAQENAIHVKILEPATKPTEPVRFAAP